MPEILTDEQVAFFEREGYLAPLPLVSEERAGEFLAALEESERETGRKIDSLELKVHLYFDWFNELVHSEPLTAYARDLLGPDVLIWATRFWLKRAGDEKYVGWHQDMAYFQLDPPDMITMWMAVTNVTKQAGAMKFQPGSHRDLKRHIETGDKKSLLTRGQYVADVDEATAVDIELRPGEMSIHHGNLLHASPPNLSDGPRIGAAVMMFPTHVKSVGPRRTATLISGEDRYHYWDPDPEPHGNMDPAILQFMDDAIAQYRKPVTQASLRDA